MLRENSDHENIEEAIKLFTYGFTCFMFPNDPDEYSTYKLITMSLDPVDHTQLNVIKYMADPLKNKMPKAYDPEALEAWTSLHKDDFKDAHFGDIEDWEWNFMNLKRVSYACLEQPMIERKKVQILRIVDSNADSLCLGFVSETRFELVKLFFETILIVKENFPLRL